MARVVCPACRTPLQARAARAGGLVGCGRCGHSFRLPPAAPAPAAPAGHGSEAPPPGRTPLTLIPGGAALALGLTAVPLSLALGDPALGAVCAAAGVLLGVSAAAFCLAFRGKGAGLALVSLAVGLSAS